MAEHDGELVGVLKAGSTVECRRILRAVRQLQPTYRAEVARQTRLNPTLVTGIINELLVDGLLVEHPSGGLGEGEPARTGRPPQMLRIHAQAREVLAIDLEPDRLRVASYDLMLNCTGYRERLIDRHSEPELVCKQIVELVEELSEGGAVPRLGVGVSLPGQIDLEQGILISSTNMPKWRRFPIRGVLERELGGPVIVERSMHLAALSERYDSSESTRLNTLVMSLRTGVGLSFMRQGDLCLGDRGYCGEIGHTVIELDGRPCECGNRGCLETFVSASAICEQARAMVDAGRCPDLKKRLERGEPFTPELVYEHANIGDPDCIAIVRDVGKYLGIALSNAINIFAPDDVVLCGSIDTAQDLLLPAVREQVDTYALPTIRKKMRLRLSIFTDKAPLMGAAVMISDRLFAPPRQAITDRGRRQPPATQERVQQVHSPAGVL